MAIHNLFTVEGYQVARASFRLYPQLGVIYREINFLKDRC